MNDSAPVGDFLIVFLDLVVTVSVRVRVLCMCLSVCICLLYSPVRYLSTSVSLNISKPHFINYGENSYYYLEIVFIFFHLFSAVLFFLLFPFILSAVLLSFLTILYLTSCTLAIIFFPFYIPHPAELM